MEFRHNTLLEGHSLGLNWAIGPVGKQQVGRARPRPAPLIVISRDSGIKFMDALIAAYNMLSFSRDRQCMSAQLDVGSSNIRVGNNSIFHICCWSSKTQGKNSTEEQLQSLILALMIERLISRDEFGCTYKEYLNNQTKLEKYSVVWLSSVAVWLHFSEFKSP